MFPLRDHNPSERTPYVTIFIVFVNLVLFVLTSPWLGGMDGLWERGALYPAAVTQGAWMWGLVTHMFLHAGPLHLGGNMLFLWIFGDNLEDQMGHAAFAAFYLASGLAAAAAQIATDPGSGVPMVGASGAVAGIMGGYLLMFPRARVDVVAIIVIIIKRFAMPAWLMLALWFGFQLASGYATWGAESGVAYAAHIGGFAAGMLLTVPLFLRRGGSRFWAATQGQPPHAPIDYTPSRVPQVRR